jgi:hypothetical protein
MSGLNDALGWWINKKQSLKESKSTSHSHRRWAMADRAILMAQIISASASNTAFV